MPASCPRNGGFHCLPAWLRNARQYNLGEAVQECEQGLLGPSKTEDIPPDLLDSGRESFFGPTSSSPRTDSSCSTEGRMNAVGDEKPDRAAIRLSVAQTKGKKARTLPVYGDMERWLKHQKETCLDGRPWVFHGSMNRPVDNHLNGWVDVCKRAGLDGLLFHDLRRSAVRNMTRAGIADTIAMSISGHKTRAVFDRYNIVSEADVQGAADKLEQYAERRKGERAAPLQRVK
jgi:hypothetical protein